MGYFDILQSRLAALTLVSCIFQTVNAQPNVATAISVEEYGNRISTSASALFNGLQSDNQTTRQQAAATFSQQLGVSSADVLLGYQQSGEDAATAGSQVDSAIKTALQAAQTGTGIEVNIDEIARITSQSIQDAVDAIGQQDLSAVANKVATDIVNPVFQTFIPLIQQSFVSTSTSTSGGGSATASSSVSVSSSSSSTPVSSSSTSTSISSTAGKPDIEDLTSSLESVTSSAISSTVSVSSLVNNWVVNFVQAIGTYIGQILVSGNIDSVNDAQAITDVVVQSMEDVFQAADFDTDLLEDAQQQIQTKLVDAFSAADQPASNLTAILNEASQGVLDVIVNALNSGSGSNVVVSSSSSVGSGTGGGGSSSTVSATSVSTSSSTTITADTMASVEQQKQQFADQFIVVLEQIQGAPTSTQNVQAFLSVILQGVLNATALVIQDDTATQAETISEFFRAGLEGAQAQIGGSFTDLNVDEVIDEIQSKAAEALKDVDFSQTTIDISGLAQTLGEELFTILGNSIGTVVSGFDISGVSFTASGSTSDSSTSTSTSISSSSTPASSSGSFSISSSTSSSGVVSGGPSVVVEEPEIQLVEVVNSTIVDELKIEVVDNFTVSFKALADQPTAKHLDDIIDVILKVIITVARSSNTDDVAQRSTVVLNLLNETLGDVLSEVGGDFEKVNVSSITDEIYTLSFNIFTEYETTGQSDIQKIVDNAQSDIAKVVTDEIVEAVPAIQAVAGSIEVAPSSEAPTPTTIASVSVSATSQITPAPIPTPTPAPAPTPAPIQSSTTSTTTPTQDFTVSPEGISVVDFKVSVGQLAESGLANVTNADNIQDAVNSFASQFGINLANVIVYLFQNGIGDVNNTSSEIASAINDALTASISVNTAFKDLDIDKIVSQIQSDLSGSLQSLENGGDDATKVVENIANQVVNIIFDAVFTVASQQGLGSQPIQASFIFNATASSIEDLRDRLTRETQSAFSQINSQTPSSENEAIISQLSVNMANILGNVLLTVLEAGNDKVDAVTEAGNITDIVESVLTQVVSEFDLVDLDVDNIVNTINVTLIEAITAAQQPDAEINSILQRAASSIFSSIVTSLGSALGLNISGTVTISTNSTTTATTSTPAPVSAGLSPEQFSEQLEGLFNLTFTILSEEGGSSGSVQEAVGNLVSQLSLLIANVTVNIVSDVGTDTSDKAKAIAGSFETALAPVVAGLSGDLSTLDIENITNNIENVAFTVFSNISDLSSADGETVTINLTPLVQELVNTVVQIIITQLTETIPGFQFSISVGATSTPETATTTTTTTSSTSTSSIKGTTLVTDVCTCYTEEEFDARVMEVVNKMLASMNVTSMP